MRGEGGTLWTPCMITQILENLERINIKYEFNDTYYKTFDDT